MIEVADDLAIEGKITLRIQRNKEVCIGKDEKYPNRNACKVKQFRKDQADQQQWVLVKGFYYL